MILSTIKNDLTVFMLPMGGGVAASSSILALQPLFRHMDFSCRDNDEVNQRQKFTNWYMLLYDNEVPDMGLLDGLSSFMNNPFDFIIVYRKGWNENGSQRLQFSPRVFRSYVPLDSENLLPYNSDGLRHEKILNGFILDVSH